MSDTWIAAVVGDIGSTKEVLPSMRVISEHIEEINIRWFVDPGPLSRAGIILDEAGVLYEKRLPRENDNPSVIVVGTNATAVEAQIAWTDFGRTHSIPVIWIEDMFGTGSRKETQSVSPDLLFTIHPIAEEIAKRVRPGLKTRTLGKPSFERIPDLIERKYDLREKAREALGVKDRFTIAWLFAGEPQERTWHQVKSFKGELKRLQKLDAVVVARFHPKHPEKAGLEAHLDALLGGRSFRETGTLDDAILAADFVVADWGSTDSFTSLFLTIPIATTLFPDDTERRLAAGYIDGLPPILTDHPVWALESIDDMFSVAKLVQQLPHVAVEETRERIKQFEDLLMPEAAERIAGNIVTLYRAHILQQERK